MAVPARPVPERKRRVKMVVWSSAWLAVLANPAGELARGDNHPAAVAATMLVLFVGLYLTLLWVASDPNRGVRVKLALLAPLAAISLVGGLAYHGTWVFLFFFLSAGVACAVPERFALFGIVAVTVLDAIVVTRNGASTLSERPQIFGVFISGLVVMFIIRMTRLISELNSAREDLARLAVADERLRFARDLHDLLGHTLSLIVVKSEAVRRLVGHDVEAATRESGDIEMVSRQALAEVREAVTNYRERSLEAELEGARIALLAAGIEASIRRPSERLPDPVESVLGWTVREGVTNVVRHSRGRHCDIHIGQVDGVATLEIRDDGDGDALKPASVVASGVGGASGGGGDAAAGRESGAGGDSGAGGAGGGLGGEGPRSAAGGGGRAPSDRPGGERVSAGTGLRGLAERLAAANGRLEAGHQPGGGFRLAVTVPLNAGGGAAG